MNETSIKIAILSDSHKRVGLTLDALEYLKNKGASYFIHAGDLEVEENLQSLHNLNLPYVTIFGNNDTRLIPLQNKYNIYKEPYYFKIKDISFKLMHLPFYMTPDTNIVVSGHTHIFEHQYINDTLFINPGEICAREKDLTECVLLEITKTQYKIFYHYKKPKDKDWKTKSTLYDIKKEV
jgi:putative phosphoesterase